MNLFYFVTTEHEINLGQLIMCVLIKIDIMGILT